VRSETFIWPFLFYFWQNGLGEGGMYTLFAGAMIIAELLILLVAWKGEKWRENAEKTEKA
jgi:hypothetical protein